MSYIILVVNCHVRVIIINTINVQQHRAAPKKTAKINLIIISYDLVDEKHNDHHDVFLEELDLKKRC